MNQYLVFRLYGPMASWGEIAVGEVRRSAPYPSKSAILGLLAAALGLRREEQARHDALSGNLELAFKIESVGTMLRDYHTVQVPDSVGGFRYATRRDEIVVGRDRLGTILSSREYRCDALSIVAVRQRSDLPPSLTELQQRLLAPVFIPYLGRKSCPLSLPMHPQIIAAAGFKGALDSAVFPPLLASRDGLGDQTDRYLDLSQVRYYWEGEAGDMVPQQTTERYDVPVNRKRWQFAPRQENMLVEERRK